MGNVYSKFEVGDVVKDSTLPESFKGKRIVKIDKRKKLVHYEDGSYDNLNIVNKLYSKIGYTNHGNFNLLDEETLLVTSVMYLLVYGVPKTDITGKSARKRLIRELGKALAILREKDKKEYLILIELSSKMITDIPNEMKLASEKDISNAVITPDRMLEYIKLKRPDIFKHSEITDKTLESLSKVYGASGHGFRSIMYVNRMFKHINNIVTSPTIDRNAIYKRIMDKYNKEKV